MYGWRARIGHLYPSGGITGEFELQRMAPQGVAFLTTRLRFPKADLEHDLRVADFVEEAALLVADARVDIIAFNCTVGSLIHGIGYDRQIAARIAGRTGIPATTTISAVLAALNALSARRITLVTPYLPEITDIEVRFLTNCGIEVLSAHADGRDDPYEQAAAPPYHWYRLTRSLRNERADAYFISCAGITVVEVIQHLEQDLGRPVLTSNQALLWHCLRTLGIRSKVDGFGILLRDL
jgi:maleate isomerase